MKIAAELRIKHGELYEACLRAGGVKQFCKKIGVGYQTMRTWLSMKKCPTPGKYTPSYTAEVEQKIEELTGLKIDAVFPKQLKEFTELSKPTKYVSVKEIEPDRLLDMACELSNRLTTNDPIDCAIAGELRDNMKKQINKLSPRLKRVIEARYYENKTLEDVGKELVCTKERARQLETKAIRALQARHWELGDYKQEESAE